MHAASIEFAAHSTREKRKGADAGLARTPGHNGTDYRQDRTFCLLNAFGATVFAVLAATGARAEATTSTAILTSVKRRPNVV